jgi:hypothetical protein
VDEHSIDAETGASGKGFAGDLEKDSLVHVEFNYRMTTRGTGCFQDTSYRGSPIAIVSVRCPMLE